MSTGTKQTLAKAASVVLAVTMLLLTVIEAQACRDKYPDELEARPSSAAAHVAAGADAGSAAVEQDMAGSGEGEEVKEDDLHLLPATKSGVTGPVTF